MKKKDLIEFLRSTVESDAIVSRLFNLFHLKYQYSIQELNSIVEYGLEIGAFTIEDVTDSDKKYVAIDWKGDNIYQELLMTDKSEYIESLFSGEGKIPDDFEKFLNNSH